MPDATLQTEAQGLVDYAQTLTDTGEKLMFTMDVPYVPAQQTPIVLAQAATSGATPQPDYILKDCQEIETTGDLRSAMRSVDPAGSLAVYIGNRDNRSVYSDRAAMASIKITLLEAPAHGELISGTSDYAKSAYVYDPEPDYVGKDRAVFMAEFEGKRYKIVIELHVLTVVDENNPTCPEPKLIKVKNPSTGSSSYDLNSVTVTFADLDGAAIGLTDASGITLDTNAAGYNWFIDTTPADNSEYLPTSNPNEGVAKEGADAYGKMDMLSVLLHEYGHALGIEHSADNHDYMATTLTTFSEAALGRHARRGQAGRPASKQIDETNQLDLLPRQKAASPFCVLTERRQGDGVHGRYSLGGGRHENKNRLSCN